MKRPSRSILLALSAFAIAVIAGGGYVAVRSFAHPAPIYIAFANSLSGPLDHAGTEYLNATRLYLKEANRAGGVDGRPIELVVFDDASDPATAARNAEAIAKSPCVAVLGHYLTTTSLAAGPLYQAAHIPAVTGTALSDAVTEDNPYYFQAQTTNGQQGRSIAEYVRNVLKAPVVQVVIADDPFGDSFLAGFVQGFSGLAEHTRRFNPDPDKLEQSLREVVDAIAGEAEPGVIVLGTDADFITLAQKAIRRAGIKSLVIAGSEASSEEFLSGFATEPEEKQHPGYFTENFYFASPVMFDSTGDEGQRFAIAYANFAHGRAGWIAAGAYNATAVMVEALRRARLSAKAENRDADRQQVRDALAAVNSAPTAVQGLEGPLYFDEHRNMPRPSRFGFFRKGRLVSAPLQLVQVEDPSQIDTEDEIRKGHMLQIADRYYWRQRVVYTGLDINRINRIDMRNRVFNADFYLWMRFAGDDNKPTRIEFPALVDRGAFRSDQPLEQGIEDGLTYRLYRVSGDLKDDYDLHDYPFDTQLLTIRFHNGSERSELIAYVIDTFGLHLADGSDASRGQEALSSLQLWHSGGIRYYLDAVALASTLGKPLNYDSRTVIEHPAFTAEIEVHRDFFVFMLKTLAPLFLLTLVVFATLFFPPSLNKERTTIPVTGILASAVLLVSMNSQLPDVGYTVAIENAFFVFFALCLMSMLSGLLNEKLRTGKLAAWTVTIDHSARIVYVVTVIGMIGWFWLRYIVR